MKRFFSLVFILAGVFIIAGCRNPSLRAYTVTFNTQGIGTAPAMLTVAEGSKLTAAQIPSPTAIPTNKSFDGWFKDPAGAQPWNYNSDTVTADITLYAKWSDVHFTVRFDTRGLTTPPAPVTVIKNHTIPATDIPNPTHRTWNFSGWYKDKNCNTQWNTASDTVTADITLYAKWTPKSLLKKELWESKKTEGLTNYFRIPALAQTKDGTLIAVTDLRYNHTADIGRFGPNGEWNQHSDIHRVDVMVKRSTDNGLTWDSSSTKITNTPDNPVKYGYGDAAIVADRDSDNVLIICAHGDTRYGDYTAGNASTRLKVVRIRSSNGGRTFTSPEDITTSIYGLNGNWGTLFFGSGKIMQSRKIKKGSYYRIYSAILITDTAKHLFGNAVLYSDDFGETWQVLGDATVSPIPNGDEAKVEELPDGRVLLSSRTENGRLFNIFTYINEGTANGHWENAQSMPLENERGTNGEICIIKVRKADTKAPVYLALQSIPLSSKRHLKGGPEPNIRMDVGIYWRVIEENISLSALADSTKWKKYQVFTGESGYSTMVMQQDHRIGFLYEKYDHDVTYSTDMNDVYDIRYESLPISTITNGEFEAAFLTE
ncbi:InlB B-repeat-containing protein [Treponema sp. OMZ 855]|uniref:InlB B-repeat-containing protein n=1 Tax=Treponema sp. OMZ 855 TaxID=1643512 RepID=UPI0020A39FC9|nr:InlB B-repeat-containing protein [Treponema sp. OMZ 855]UTC51834.1 InlB B-repeat-containing protein [Treponema sp. OMZ 855]